MLTEPKRRRLLPTYFILDVSSPTLTFSGL
jgi:hypothetical protein